MIIIVCIIAGEKNQKNENNKVRKNGSKKLSLKTR